jgi:acyl-CoA dehydrogenase
MFRKNLISKPLFHVLKKKMPVMSKTEREALDAADSGWESEIFQGRPNWEKLHHIKTSTLTKAEQAFLDNETTTLCSMLDDWKISYRDKDLSPKVWKFIKDNGFFGLVIQTQYGGKGFSAALHSAVVMKLATRSVSAAVTVMVPNSLGPGELLHRYGTSAQQKKFLPDLASGKAIPCFALTSAPAGSDASSMRDTGVVCHGTYKGKTIVGIKLNFSKRYITLAPIATLVGLAFRLQDPEHLIGNKTNVGITCALLDAKHPGLTIGQRHLPMELAFMNGSIEGKAVFVPLDAIIGGTQMAGAGWRMLVECLAIGRAISLPALSCAQGALGFITTSSYAALREQFRTPLFKMEGVESALAKIAGYTYLLESCRTLTVTAVDDGLRPATASAIAKYHMTEFGRKILNHAMDVHGGRAIMMGPKNYLARAYQGIPISITVEGANILTRNLIIFGQGALNCHPYLRAEMDAFTEPDKHKALTQFDHALFGHVGLLFKHIGRATGQGITAGRFIRALTRPAAHHYRNIERLSQAYALVADSTLILLGGALKRKERLSARLGDVMSYLYLASAALKMFKDHGEDPSERPLLDWAVQYCVFQAQEALWGLFANLPNRAVALTLRALCFPWGKPHVAPSDKLEHQVVGAMLKPSAFRERLAKHAYMPDDAGDPIGKMEVAFKHWSHCQPILATVRHAIRAGKISRKARALEQYKHAFTLKLITKPEHAMLKTLETYREDIIQVDVFSHDLKKEL